MAHTTGNVIIHMIFSTKGRKPLLTLEFRSDVLAYLGGIVQALHADALIINDMSDHVHMLVRIRPAHSPAEIARIVKTNSSRWAREKGHKDFAWQTGYGVFSVSESMFPKSPNTLPSRKSIIANEASRKSLLRF